MERSFRKLKATILTSTTVKSVKVNAEGKCDVEVEGKKGTETLVADIVLSAVGIKSNIEDRPGRVGHQDRTRQSHRR